ncbi:MAG TPA: DUF3465 domain-containing protein [Chthoniobacteraceae bacterium]|nr:DUF3465 domain-containing protein [Chthoniobacteraceae bacterium]
MSAFRKIRIVFYIIIVVAVWYSRSHLPLRAPAGGGAGSEMALADAIRDHASDVQVEGSGRVEKVLPDDTEGEKHQKFILRLESGDTLLFAHNIDIAPRVDGLKEGDEIFFKGYYVWNDKGGIVHWTHHDPEGKHAAGYLKLDGRVYQ